MLLLIAAACIIALHRPLKALVMQLLSLLHLGNSIVVSAASLTYGFRRNHDNRRL